MASIGPIVHGLAVFSAAAIDPIPAAPPISGPVWSVVVPAVLFGIALAATWLLYRFFARRGGS